MNSNSFIDNSREIADDFLQTIVLIDDLAYKTGDRQHELNAFEVTRSFARNRKMCSIYQPEKEGDIEDLTRIAKKADIVILDWKLLLKEEEPGIDDGEEVDDEDDPRGEYTIRIINEVVGDKDSSGLKLIIVYTGEINLASITHTIYSSLKDVSNAQIDDFSIVSDSFIVTVIGKPFLTAKHNPAVQQRIIAYENLPEFAVSEFIRMTSGLISDFVLGSLCILRSNIPQLLKLFNRSLDPAFLAHSALLPNYEDAKEQLVEMLSHSLNALLNYNKAGENLSIERINSWIESKPLDKHLERLSINLASGGVVKIDKQFLKTWIYENFDEACKVAFENETSKRLSNKNKEDIRKVERNMHQNATKYFTESASFEELDCDFSILTHQKSNLKQPSQVPKLSLGSIVKKQDGDNFQYFVCIQQKCDSVRISNRPRKFLFLPLKPVNNKQGFHFVVNDGNKYVYLKVDFKIYNIHTEVFSSGDNSGSVRAKQDGESGAYYFKSQLGEFFWLSDLKDAHAQRLANLFAGQISRVGLDESEWLRRWATD